MAQKRHKHKPKAERKQVAPSIAPLAPATVVGKSVHVDTTQLEVPELVGYADAFSLIVTKYDFDVSFLDSRTDNVVCRVSISRGSVVDAILRASAEFITVLETWLSQQQLNASASSDRALRASDPAPMPASLARFSRVDFLTEVDFYYVSLGDIARAQRSGTSDVAVIPIMRVVVPVVLAIAVLRRFKEEEGKNTNA